VSPHKTRIFIISVVNPIPLSNCTCIEVMINIVMKEAKR